MRVHQYVYFALASTRMPAAEITTRLGIEPDEVTTRGSRRAEPPRPAAHRWRVVCREPGRTVDEQLRRVVDRLDEHADRIGELVTELRTLDDWPSVSTLQVVRIFDHPDGEEEEVPPPIGGLTKLAGQHQLLGWHVDARTVDFLRATRAELDVDEYAGGRVEDRG
ncbi:DUF4279 domain-containing protein [Jiangella endophytica]|uniref:DUF4279 domain-containing protein n=1 Tax=Jiangella endophytica TaxID=1623398 RepID=UPI000E355262|nr:DUF4279 domain-containing protein [Jiangella endophytica]